MELTPNSPVPGTVGLDLTIDFIFGVLEKFFQVRQNGTSKRKALQAG